MGERHHHSGVGVTWDRETTPNTPFIAQVQHLLNLHTPLRREFDRTFTQGASQRVRRLGGNRQMRFHLLQ